MTPDNWLIIFLLPSASIALTICTYFGCRAQFRIEEVLPRWAKERGFRIVRSDFLMYSLGPFRGSLFMVQYRPAYRVIVEDQQKRQRKVWVRLGWWYIVGFREKIEEHWDD